MDRPRPQPAHSLLSDEVTRILEINYAFSCLRRLL
jgi:hypothetical protein